MAVLSCLLVAWNYGGLPEKAEYGVCRGQFAEPKGAETAANFERSGDPVRPKKCITKYGRREQRNHNRKQAEQSV